MASASSCSAPDVASSSPDQSKPDAFDTFDTCLHNAGNVHGHCFTEATQRCISISYIHCARLQRTGLSQTRSLVRLNGGRPIATSGSRLNLMRQLWSGARLLAEGGAGRWDGGGAQVQGQAGARLHDEVHQQLAAAHQDDGHCHVLRPICSQNIVTYFSAKLFKTQTYSLKITVISKMMTATAFCPSADSHFRAQSEGA